MNTVLLVSTIIGYSENLFPVLCVTLWAYYFDIKDMLNYLIYLHEPFLNKYADFDTSGIIYILQFPNCLHFFYLETNNMLNTWYCT